MVEMGFGLSREDVMLLASVIAEKSGEKHPFHDGMAGRGWFDGFRTRHPHLTLRTPQPLSYTRGLSANHAVIEDFFAKLGALYARLNLFSKPMLIYNIDETGVSVVHKMGKVLAEVVRKMVSSLTSGERGKTHMVITCVSASGFALPVVVFPRFGSGNMNCLHRLGISALTPKEEFISALQSFSNDTLLHVYKSFNF
jgi:hypothetical protein